MKPATDIDAVMEQADEVLWSYGSAVLIGGRA